MTPTTDLLPSLARCLAVLSCLLAVALLPRSAIPAAAVLACRGGGRVVVRLVKPRG